MTLSFWIRPEAGCTEFPIVRSPRRDVVFNGSSGFYWFEAYTADGRQLYNGCAHPRRLKSGEWHHFALVYDQTGVATYLDGRPTGRADADKATGELRFSGVPWRIGGRLYESGGKASGFFRGLLDDFKVLPVAKHAFPEVEKIKRQQRLNAAGFRSNAELEQARRNAMAARFGKEAALLPFAVAGVSALDRLLPDDLFTGEIGAPVKFTAAANERENRQLLLLPYGGNNLPGVTVEVPGTLTGQDGKAVPFRFKVSRIEYAKLPKPSPFMYPLERIPDKLISGDTFDLPGDALAPLWLEVFVPAGTPGGVYRGALSVTAPGNPPLELPVEVKVWNFELPRRNIVPTLVNVWERDLQTYVPEGDAAGFVDLLDQYCTMLLEHRLNPVVLAHAGLVAPWVRKAVYPDYRVENGRVVANMEVFDRLVAKYRRMGLSKVAIGPHYNFDQTKLGGGDWWTNIRATQPEKVWSFIQTHAEEQGFLDDAVAYPIDEPEDNVEFINRVTGMLKRAATADAADQRRRELSRPVDSRRGHLGADPALDQSGAAETGTSGGQAGLDLCVHRPQLSESESALRHAALRHPDAGGRRGAVRLRRLPALGGEFQHLQKCARRRTQLIRGRRRNLHPCRRFRPPGADRPAQDAGGRNGGLDHAADARRAQPGCRRRDPEKAGGADS